MRRWWKWAGVCAGGLASLGSFLTSVSAQFPPPNGGGFGMPPGMGMMTGMPPMAGMGGPPPGAFGGNPKLSGMPAEFPNPAQPSGDPISPFTLKDEGYGGAFTECIDPRNYVPYRFQISAGYTFVWFRPANFPVLATTGSVTDLVPGALGQAGTIILSGGTRDPGASSAFRTTFRYWLADPERFSLDGEFIIMEQRSIFNNFASDGNGNPVLTRPFFDPNATGLGGENADPRALPGVVSGTLSDSIRTRLMSGDLNLKWHSSPSNVDGARANVFVGARWLRLDERYLSTDTTQTVGGGGGAIAFSDNFSTVNNFYGGQFGGEVVFKLGRAELGLLTKVAVGPNYRRINISGESTFTDLSTGASVTDNTQALFAQPSNVGGYSDVHVAVLSEFGSKLNFCINDHMRFHVGYSFLWMSDVVRPGDQMDRTINNRQQPIGGAGAGLPPLPPALPGPPTFNRTNFNAHMLHLGLEFCF